MKLGFVGLGKMGSRMVEKMLKEGHEVTVWNRTKDVSLEFEELMIKKGLHKKLLLAESIRSLVQGLEKPRIVWSMLPQGEATESMMNALFQLGEKDDIAIDGGNSFYKDTQQRFEKMKTKGIRFLGIGLSGGIIASQTGYPLMVGGDKSAYEYIEPMLKSLSKPGGGYDYFGQGGAGHFIKMVHNAIEYGYMQSLGEGFGVLESSKFRLDLLKVAKLYQKGTLISGFMLDRGVEALEKNPHMEHIRGIIEESGEARWTVEEAKEKNLPIDAIETSLLFRIQSKTDKAIQASFAAKFVSALRNAFGGHKVKKS